MEFFLPIIIGIVIAAIAGSKKKKQQGESNVPPAHGENFPFPKELRELLGMEDEDSLFPKNEGQVSDFHRLESVEQYNANQESVEQYNAEQEGVAMTVAQHIKKNEHRYQRSIASDDSPMEVDHFGVERHSPIEDFDLRKAVIYSEILKPKFNDNFF